jgi:thiamine kinase-like enzyme
MNKQKAPIRITDNLSRHPAVNALSALNPDLPQPDAIELIRYPKPYKAHIVRLVCEKENGYSIVGKGTDSSKALIEKSAYENLFKFLPYKGLQYYGYIETDNDFAWNFMEDARGIPFSFENPEHVLLAEDWLAKLHTRVPSLDCFPKLDVNFYYSRLLSGYERITANFSNSALTDSDKVALKSIISHFDILHIRRDKVTKLYEQMPKGFIHGDIKSKNMRVRSDGQESMLVVFDWEECGWGLPAIDVTRSSLNLKDYWLKVRNHWQGWTFEDMLQMSNLGKLLNSLVAINWEAKSLPYQWIDKSMASMKIFEERLANLIQLVD